MKGNRVAAVLLAVVAAAGVLGGCGGNVQEIDSTKTQLYIGNFDGGMGSRWLDEYIKGFEELYKDTPFEDGKTGVEVVPLNDKVMFEADTIQQSIANSTVNLFFTEGVNYYEFVDDGLLYDISDIVEADIPGEEESIEAKLSEQQRSYYAVDGQYYGLPHYRTFRGIVYDIDLFNEKRLYIKSDGTINGRSTDTDLSAGPDGDPETTYDNGLPATYEEFFNWCDYVKTYKNVIPICWTGAYKESYTKHLLDALRTDAQGYVGAQLLHSVDADAAVDTTLISGFSEEIPQIAQETITRSNYKEVVKSEGVYYSLKFLSTLIENNYYYSLSMNSTQTHELTHYDFLHSRFDPDTTPIAMMIEGTWWEEESNDIFASMAQTYDNASREERNFGFLPLPKTDATKAGPQVLFDGNMSMVFVNGNCDAVHADLAKKFIQYISTDANLQLFNTITGIARDYEFSLTTEQKSSLTTFASSIDDLISANGGIVYGYALSRDNYLWSAVNQISLSRSRIGDNVYTEPINAFRTGVSAEAYFNGIWRNANV